MRGQGQYIPKKKLDKKMRINRNISHRSEGCHIRCEVPCCTCISKYTQIQFNVYMCNKNINTSMVFWFVYCKRITFGGVYFSARSINC